MATSGTVFPSSFFAIALKWITSPVRASLRDAVSSSERTGFSLTVSCISAVTFSALAVRVVVPGFSDVRGVRTHPFGRRSDR